MLSNLIFCLNATVPIFALMLLGLFFMKKNIFNEAFVAKMNSFVFRIALPVLVFYDLCKEDFYSIWNTKFVAFCFFGTLAEILLVTGISYLLPNRLTQGEFIQVAYRSSAAILGLQFVTNIYGNAGVTPLMMLGSVPLYNIAAVTVLSIYSPKNRGLSHGQIKSTLLGIITNPIILGILAGMAWSLLRIPMPQMLDNTVQSVARVATPLGIMAMGASFDLKQALASFRTAGLATFIKLVGVGMILLPIAVLLGFRDSSLVALIIMCGSPTTVSCYVMAKEMGHEGTLTSSTVMLATLLSSVTLTLWLFLFRTLGMI